MRLFIAVATILMLTLLLLTSLVLPCANRSAGEAANDESATISFQANGQVCVCNLRVRYDAGDTDQP